MIQTIDNPLAVPISIYPNKPDAIHPTRTPSTRFLNPPQMVIRMLPTTPPIAPADCTMLRVVAF